MAANLYPKFGDGRALVGGVGYGWGRGQAPFSNPPKGLGFREHHKCGKPGIAREFGVCHGKLNNSSEIETLHIARHWSEDPSYMTVTIATFI